jgi:hypothetical protein
MTYLLLYLGTRHQPVGNALDTLLGRRAIASPSPLSTAKATLFLLSLCFCVAHALLRDQSLARLFAGTSLWPGVRHAPAADTASIGCFAWECLPIPAKLLPDPASVETGVAGTIDIGRIGAVAHCPPSELERQRCRQVTRASEGMPVPVAATGKLTAPKWTALAKCSLPTAQRDLKDLVDRGILIRNSGGSKNTSYSIAGW